MTQTTSMVLASILWILTITWRINVIEIGILAFLLWCANAVDMPARQTFIIEMVWREKLNSAIALNGWLATISRAVWPWLAWVLIAYIWIWGAFIVNAASYIAVIIAILMVNTVPIVKKSNLHPLKAVKEWIKYAFDHKIIRLLLLTMWTVSIFWWSASAIFPVIVHNSFHRWAEWLWYIFAASGLGSLIAATLISAKWRKVYSFTTIVRWIFIMAIALLIFASTKNFYIALVSMFFYGWWVISIVSTSNSTIQYFVQEEYRWRAMSLYIFTFMWVSPIWNVLIWYMGDKYWTMIAVSIWAVVILVLWIYLIVNRVKIRNNYDLLNIK
jgi:MFS family permease